MKLNSVCVYCGSSPGASAAYMEAARAFGRLLAVEGITLVYGGGSVGLMGAAADSALQAGGSVIGVIPEKLADMGVGHSGLTRLYTVPTMHARKQMMAELSDACVALPGGIGTMEEIFEAFTWTQLGYHLKPCAFLDVDRYYPRLFEFLEHMADQRFLKREHLASLIQEQDPRALLQKLRGYEPVKVEKWLDRDASRQDGVSPEVAYRLQDPAK